MKLLDFNLEKAAAIFDESGFETTIEDRVLIATREDGDQAFDVRVDLGGQTLVEIKQHGDEEKTEKKILEERVAVISEVNRTIRFRVVLGGPEKTEDLVVTLENFKRD